MMRTQSVVCSWLVGLLVTLVCHAARADEVVLVTDKVQPAIQDAVELMPAADAHLEGWLGDRVRKNVHQRLVRVDLEPLLAGFRQKPGSHAWIGEHIGKWLHAATLAWANSGDAALKTKLDDAAAALIATQEADGYLGTYTPDKRFGLYPESDWDVWSHKYCMIGLLTHYRYTGSDESLAAARRAADLLLATFGPGKKSILTAGTHVGMASTSVLEPMVDLYRLTGEERYLDFAKYLVESWNEPNGPQVLTSLSSGKSTAQTANAKAYEMLSNLVGLCDLYRVTGDEKYLVPVVNAWDDIVSKRLYITGSMSQHERFQADYYLPNGTSAEMAETCVSVTWIQLNSQLLRLTGDARYAHELERTLYNHLTAAQKPDGTMWCYYTSLQGQKPYGPGISCCVSSGPRGMALAPLHAAVIRRGTAGVADRLLISLLEPATLEPQLDGTTVTVTQTIEAVDNEQLTLAIRVNTPHPVRFALGARVPEWSRPMTLTSPDLPAVRGREAEGWQVLPVREWKDGDTATVVLKMNPRVIASVHTNRGKAALAWGPLVLAYDEKYSGTYDTAATVAIAEGVNADGLKIDGIDDGLTFSAMVRSAQDAEPHLATLVPFADAGRDGGRFRVWLHDANADVGAGSSGIGVEESRSRQGNVEGSITDGDDESFVVTWDGNPSDEDWFAIDLKAPTKIAAVTFTHGNNYHDGGWFDTSMSKPEVQVRTQPSAKWTTVGKLSDYPATTADSPAGIAAGQQFVLELAEPMHVIAVRVVGKPAHGDDPRQAFSSCAAIEVTAAGN